MRSVLRDLMVIVVLAGVAGLAGCGAGPGTLTGGGAKLVENENSAAFLDRISSQVNVSENDAMRGVLLVLDGKDQAATFEQRVETLRKRKIVAERWDCDAARPLTRGKLAYMVYQACKVPGGVILRLTGPSRRYCLRELQYREMMGDGFLMSPVSGMEYVAVLTRADVYRRTGEIPDITGKIEGE
jgi:hypothetical protein